MDDIVLELGPGPVLSQLSVLFSTRSWVLSAMSPRRSLPAELADA